MKKVIIVSIFTLYCLVPLHGQKRVDGPNVVNIYKQSQIVSPIIGWSYDNNYNKWCAYYGMILKKYKNNNKKPIYPDNDLYSYNDEEILSLQMKSVNFKGETIYLLYIGQQDYYYDYPLSEVGYHSYKKKTVYLIKKEEYEKMWNLQIGINKIRILSGGYSFGHPRATYNNQAEMLVFQFNDKFSLDYTDNNHIIKGKFEPMTWYILKSATALIR